MSGDIGRNWVTDAARTAGPTWNGAVTDSVKPGSETDPPMYTISSVSEVNFLDPTMIPHPPEAYGYSWTRECDCTSVPFPSERSARNKKGQGRPATSTSMIGQPVLANHRPLMVLSPLGWGRGKKREYRGFCTGHSWLGPQLCLPDSALVASLRCSAAL